MLTVSQDDAPVAVLVVPTDEEREIAEQTAACLDLARRAQNGGREEA